MEADEAMSDWEYSDKSCPKCGSDLATARCPAIYCDDGTIEDPDDEWNESETCDECNGQGWLEWCRECGWDVTDGRFLSPKHEANWRATAKAKGETGK